LKIMEISALSVTWKLFILPLAKKLIQNGFQVEALCDDRDRTLRSEIEQIALPVQVTSVPITRSIRPSLLSSYRAIYQAIRTSKPDILHTHTPVASFLARWAARRLKVPSVIYTAHGFFFHERMNPLLRYILIHAEKRMGIHTTDWIFCVNEDDYNLARAKQFAKPDRIVRIPGVGIDVSERFDPHKINDETRSTLRTQFNIPQKSKVIVFIGRMVAEKGVPELLHAFQKVLQAYPDTYLLLVGATFPSDRDQKTQKVVESIQSEKKYAQKIRIAGFREDIPEVLSIADLFILPSHREGFPVSSLEALSMGVPVIGTRIRGLKEQIVEGRTGLLSDVGDIPRLAENIKRGLELGPSWKEDCRREVVNRFSLELSLNIQLDVFNRIRLERNV